MSTPVAVRGLMAIAAREVSERVALLGLAVAVAAVPFVAPWILIGDRPLLGVLLGVVMTLSAAVLTGSSVIARDLAEGRLGFFLSRPVPWWSIWGGKMLAAIVLTFLAGAIVLGPSAIAGDWRLPPGGWWVRILVPGLIAVIGTVNVMAVGYRARSLWFAADLAMTGALAWIVVRTSRGLMVWAVWTVSYDFIAPTLWVVAAAVTMAGAAQVALGRADIARSHRVMAIAVWAVLTPAALGYAAWGTWVQRMAPSDVRSVLSAWSAPKGSWIVVTGRGAWPRPEGVSAALLVDTSTGRFLRLGPAFSPLRPGFSGDATRAAWISDPFSDTPRLTVADLGAGEPALSDVPLPVPPGIGARICAVTGRRARGRRPGPARHRVRARIATGGGGGAPREQSPAARSSSTTTVARTCSARARISSHPVRSTSSFSIPRRGRRRPPGTSIRAAIPSSSGVRARSESR